MTGSPRLEVTEFTDPACPVAFSAEPVRRRLAWLFGDQLEWKRVMVVLDDGSRPRSGGPPPERRAASRRHLHAAWGMPLDPDAHAGVSSTLDASRLVIAARLHDSRREDAVLRAVRVHAVAGGDLDRKSVERLGRAAGVAEDAIAHLEADDVAAELARDMAAARAPSRVAHALAHRLGGRGTRYSTPSYRYATEAARFELVGIHPVQTHEAVVANLRPESARSADPASVRAVLEWAGEALATAEIAAVMNQDGEEVRAQAAAVADFTSAGLDGYWTAREPVADRA